MASTSNSILKNVRVATKIYLAVAALLLLFLILFAVNYFGLNATVDNFSEFAQASESARALGAIDRDVISLQKQVSIYALTRNSAGAPRIRELGDKLEESMRAAASRASAEDSRYRLKQMQESLASYLKNFATVVEERQLRSKLVEDAIISNSSRLAKSLRSISKDSNREQDQRNAAQQALLTLTAAQNSALQYLNDPDSLVAAEALRLFASSAEQVTQLQDTISGVQDISVENDSSSDEFSALARRADQVEQDFLRTVQATRAYLYLVNVVMAGEASEFSYHSERLKIRSANALEAISDDTTLKTNQTLQLTILLSALAVVLGALITMGLVRNIIDPISAITSTFRKLLRRETVEAIPGLDRRDEIGEMARAAELLRDQSMQTEVLLKQTESLAGDLERKAEQLQKNNEDLDSFAYVASHDLKSPLRAISNVSKWIIEDAADVLPEKSREHLDVLRTRVRRMETLLDDLLEYSRVSRTSLSTQKVSVRDILLEAQETIDWPSDMKLILGDYLPSLDTEAATLSRVFMNLMTNSVKYRGERAPQLKITARDVEGSQGEEFVEFSLADNGIGIEEKYHETVFQMFKRLHLNSEIEGTGMGLALVEKIVKSHGGRIWLESTPGDGATFRFTWPKRMRAQPEQTPPTVAHSC